LEFAPDSAKIFQGNKKDLENDREVSYEEGANYAKSVGAFFLETSALTGENLGQAFVGTSPHCPR